MSKIVLLVYGLGINQLKVVAIGTNALDTQPRPQDTAPAP